MLLDRYSKFVLTVIAAALMALAVGQFKPGPAEAQVPGMTLRDYFAGQFATLGFVDVSRVWRLADQVLADR